MNECNIDLQEKGQETVAENQLPVRPYFENGSPETASKVPAFFG